MRRVSNDSKICMWAIFLFVFSCFLPPVYASEITNQEKATQDFRQIKDIVYRRSMKAQKKDMIFDPYKGPCILSFPSNPKEDEPVYTLHATFHLHDKDEETIRQILTFHDQQKIGPLKNQIQRYSLPMFFHGRGLYIYKNDMYVFESQSLQFDEKLMTLIGEKAKTLNISSLYVDLCQESKLCEANGSFLKHQGFSIEKYVSNFFGTYDRLLSHYSFSENDKSHTLLNSEMEPIHVDEVNELLSKSYWEEPLRRSPHQKFGLLVKDEMSETVGGMIAYLCSPYLVIEQLSLSPRLRGYGMGTSLVTIAESIGKLYGMKYAQLDTFDFQAPSFYKDKLGYKEIFSTYFFEFIHYDMRKTL